MASFIGKYEIIRTLGAGATSEVFLARDPASGQPVALKVLRPALIQDGSSFARFTQEARAAGGLRHANIAAVLAMGEADGRYFIVMRYVDGPSLERRLREKGPLALEDSLRLAQQIGAALDYAQKAGFIHRDVKPANILCAPDGSFVLTDFGLTKAMMTTGLSSHTGAILGTPAYIAPEVWLNQPATPATDQYALACVVYEALTGQILFQGDTPPAVMAGHMLNGPRFPKRWPGGAPKAIEAVLARGLAREPAKRYPSLIAFVQDLTRCIPVKPVPPPSAARTSAPAASAQQAAGTPPTGRQAVSGAPAAQPRPQPRPQSQSQPQPQPVATPPVKSPAPSATPSPQPASAGVRPPGAPAAAPAASSAPTPAAPKKRPACLIFLLVAGLVAAGILMLGLMGVFVVRLLSAPPPAAAIATTAPGEPTATTASSFAPAEPTATSAPGEPTATPAPGQPTATTAPPASQNAVPIRVDSANRLVVLQSGQNLDIQPFPEDLSSPDGAYRGEFQSTVKNVQIDYGDSRGVWVTRSDEFLMITHQGENEPHRIVLGSYYRRYSTGIYFNDYAISRDGTLLAVGRWDSGGVYVSLYKLSDYSKIKDIYFGALPDTMSQHMIPGLSGIALSPNNQILVFANGPVISLYRIDTGDLIAQLRGHQRKVEDIRFSTAGDRLYSKEDGGGEIVWGISQ